MSTLFRLNPLIIAFCFTMVFMFFWLADTTRIDNMAAHTQVEVLVEGAQIDGANGPGFDAENQMYIGSVSGRGIFVIDPDDGQILDYLGPEQGVEGADDLVFGPDGALYYTAILTGEVGRIAPNGIKTTVANLPLGVNPITFSDDGRLFVALDFLGDALYEVYLDGRNPRLIVDAPGWLNGMDWGQDGLLYGPLIQKQQIVKIDVDSGAITTVAGGFNYPAAVKFGPDGDLYIIDTSQVIRLDKHTGGKKVIADIELGLDNLAFDNSGRLFVTNNGLGSVYEVMPNGRVRQVVKGGMTVPAGVAVIPGRNKQDRVLVANIFSLHEFDGKTGKLLVQTLDIGNLMTISADGDLLVTSAFFGNVVSVYDLQSRQLLEEYFDFAVPLNAIHFQGDLVVAELGSSQVVRRDASTGQRTHLAQLPVPTGLASIGDDLYAADWATGTVWKIIAHGSPVSVQVAAGLDHPEGLAADLEGDLLVIEAGAGRLSRIHLKTGKVSVLAEGLELGEAGPATMPPIFVFNGVAVGPSGFAYVTGEKANVLYRINIGN